MNPGLSSLRATFEALWGGGGTKKPYEYQLQVAEYLLAGRNVVLVAPTGSGKTAAALLPLAHARMNGLCWADRLMYALPLRTLTTALRHEYGEALEKTAGLRVGLQTGLFKGDPLFRSDVCFTTIDQLLSAYVGEPVSVSPRQANVCGGALVGAYVVFDEFHLLEPRRALATALDLGARLAHFCSVLIMTATATNHVVDLAREYLDAVVVTPSPEDLGSMPAESTRNRIYRWRPEPLTAEHVLDALRRAERGRVFAVVNTVGRAQEMYQAVRSAVGDDIEVIGLHSHFLSSDREVKEKRAQELFKEGRGGRGVLIATQVVEVGLNVSCDYLLTELAPANSLVQRAGRCARFTGETGEVHIFDYPAEAARPWAPYSKEQCERTRAVIEERLGPGPVKSSFAWERALVEASLGELDAQSLHRGILAQRYDEVGSALTGDPTAAYRRYVRDIDSTTVVVDDEPSTLDLRRGIEGIAVSDGSFAAFLSGLDFEGRDARTVFFPVWSDRDEVGQEPVVEWVPVTKENLKEARRQLLLAVSSKVAAYDTEVGLRLGPSEGEPVGEAFRARAKVRTNGMASSRPEQDRAKPAVGETFRRHAEDVADRARSIVLRENRAGAGRVAKALGVPVEPLVELVSLVGRLHDGGKLDSRWQAFFRELVGQALSGSGPDETEHLQAGPVLCVDDSSAEEKLFLAHPPLDYRGPRRPPPHAVAGACLAFQLLRKGLGTLFGTTIQDDATPGDREPARSSLPFILGASVAAIARHHHSRTGSGDEFQAGKEALGQLSAIMPQSMATHIAGLPLRIDRRDMDKLLRSVDEVVDPSRHKEAWALYWLLARALRLADQESQEALRGYSGGR